MVIKTTTWSPDTCNCVLEYEWDDSADPNTRTHTLSKFIKKCSAHLALADVSGYGVITEENPRKNIARQLIIDNAPLAFVDVDLSGNKSLKPGETINFDVSGTAPNRVFGMIFGGVTLTSGQISNVQAKLDARFGVGKVMFVNTP